MSKDLTRMFGQAVKVLAQLPTDILGTVLDMLNKLKNDSGGKTLEKLKHLVKDNVKIKTINDTLGKCKNFLIPDFDPVDPLEFFPRHFVGENRDVTLFVDGDFAAEIISGSRKSYDRARAYIPMFPVQKVSTVRTVTA